MSMANLVAARTPVASEKIDGLLDFSCRYLDGIPELTFPDGSCLRGDAAEIHEELSHALARISHSFANDGFSSRHGAHAQDNLPFDAKVLRSVTQTFGLEFGVYASVTSPGQIQVGDELTLLN